MKDELGIPYPTTCTPWDEPKLSDKEMAEYHIQQVEAAKKIERRELAAQIFVAFCGDGTEITEVFESWMDHAIQNAIKGADAFLAAMDAAEQQTDKESK